jgi:hypothetical protein
LALYEDIREEEMLLIVGGHKSAWIFKLRCFRLEWSWHVSFPYPFKSSFANVWYRGCCPSQNDLSTRIWSTNTVVSGCRPSKT